MKTASSVSKWQQQVDNLRVSLFDFSEKMSFNIKNQYLDKELFVWSEKVCYPHLSSETIFNKEMVGELFLTRKFAELFSENFGTGTSENWQRAW